ncbi:hypothetical protein D3C83_80600 [compost metagenome]
MRKEVRGHEGAVGVPSHRDPVAVRHAHPDDVVHRRLGARDELLHVGVIGFLPAHRDDRHRRVIHHAVALQQREEM